MLWLQILHFSLLQNDISDVSAGNVDDGAFAPPFPWKSVHLQTSSSPRRASVPVKLLLHCCSGADTSPTTEPPSAPTRWKHHNQQASRSGHLGILECSMLLQGQVSATGIVFSYHFMPCMSKNELLSCTRDLMSGLQGFEQTECRQRSCSRYDVCTLSYLFMKAVCTVQKSPPTLTHVLVTDEAQSFIIVL